MAITETEVLEEIRTQLDAIKVPGAKDAKPDDTWAELDVDSLDLVELVKALEDKFGVTISDAVPAPAGSTDLTLRLASEGTPA